MQASEDLDGAEFGDKRLTRRLVRLVEALSADATASFPDAAKSDAELEATYRFFQNESVTPQRILAPHVAATARRARGHDAVVVAHDTTDFAFGGEREGMGRINNGGQGFFAHFALAMRADGSRYPLGVLGLHTFVRQQAPPTHNRWYEKPPEQRESFRWRQMVREVEASMADAGRLVHVMDSEADAYELLSEMIQEKRRFVVRLKFDRPVADALPGTHLEDKLQCLEGRFVREVQIAARRRKRAPKGTRNASRDARLATLCFSATKVTLLAPKYMKKAPSLTVHVVQVREVNAPADAEPVEWKLVTTEPIESVQHLETVVDFYRARWAIEEFFKALKTGCAFAKRQLESLPTLLNALAVFTPIAWELLVLRAVARHAPDADASTVLRPTQVLILQRHKHTRLAPGASVREAFLAIAQLGGHIKNNGEPGWQVLGRGYEQLLAYEVGAQLALNM